MGYDNSDSNGYEKSYTEQKVDAYDQNKNMSELALSKRNLQKETPQKDGLTKEKRFAERLENGLTRVDVNSFSEAFAKTKEAARKSNPNTWRVSDVDPKEFCEYHPDADCYLTPGNSTFAVAKNGDIVAVCRNPDDTYRGKELIEMAVELGGTKLDSYDGNHRFYVEKCGFEPVSWCKWNDEYAPSDWKESKNNREDIIFYRYTGNTNSYISKDDFKATTDVSIDYDAAMAVRDNSMRKDK